MADVVIHRARVQQALAQHQHRRNHDDRRMGKARKRVLGGHKSTKRDGQQGGQGDQIVPPPSPDEQPESSRQYEKHECLILGKHGTKLFAAS